MAHKHNRRRVRPRARRSKYNNNLPTVYETTFDSLSSFSMPSMPFPNLISLRPALNTSRKTLSLADKRTWMDPTAVVESYRYPYSENGRRNTEDVRTLRKFGGEPGDDPGLCDKMQEMFDGMDWIDTI